MLECELVDIEKKGLLPSWEDLGLPTYDPKVIAGIALVAVPYLLPPGTLPEQIAWIWGK